MSDQTSLTMADLLPDPIEGLAAQLKANAAEHGAAAVPWGVVEGEAINGLKTELTKLSVFEQMAQAWVTLGAVRAHRDPKVHPPGETGIVPLGQHSIALTAEPELNLVVAGWTAPPLKLGVVATALFESVHLSIKDGHLIAAAPGKCVLSAGLNCGSIPLHPPRELGHVKLPGQIKFAEPGWKIP
ncbi:MAG TPA: hypothetical protein VKU90_14345 [Caulobacteraceae bacterium]|nr:hypothetical protein [Caulobacteraceae bacterium]